MSSPPSLTTTSYAILGLLAVKPWTTHELVQQVDRSTRRIWPRAQSKLYEEPKKLVAHGLARATDDSVGRRRRTRYTITAKGRRALAAWLQQPGNGPVLEFEQLLQAAAGSPAERAGLLERAASLHRGEMLPGCFDEWALQEQARWSARHVDALEQWAEHVEAITRA